MEPPKKDKNNVQTLPGVATPERQQRHYRKNAKRYAIYT